MKNYNIFIITLLIISCTKKTVIAPKENASQVWNTDTSVAIQKLKLENKQIEKYIKNSGLEFMESELGFWYFKTNSKNTPLITYGNEVTFNYALHNIKDLEIYSFEEIGEQNLLIDKQEFVPGINDGLKYFSNQEEGILLLPSFKGYGRLGDQKRIGQDWPLVVYIKVKDVKTMNK